jgi:hypothetical protein
VEKLKSLTVKTCNDIVTFANRLNSVELIKKRVSRKKSILTHMKNHKLTIAGLAAVAVALVFASSARADLAFQYKLFTPTINLDTANQNGWAGTMGNAFATWQAGAVVSHVGYYDSNGDGLANSHQVHIFKSYSSGGSGHADSILASAIVPAGTAAPLVDGFRWVALSAPLSLPSGTWYTVSTDVDGIDLFGDRLVSGGFTTADPYYSTGGWNSPYARYGNDPVTDEPGFGSYPISVYPAVNVGLAVVPEPGSLQLLGAGLVALLAFRRPRR